MVPLRTRLLEDLRNYSVYVPPPGVPTRSIVREHDANTISYKATDKDVGWLFLQFRENNLILSLSGRDDADAASVVAVLLRLDSAVVERATESAPVVVVPAAGPDGTDHVAIVHPAVARVCPAKATYAMPHIHRVLPCHRCELTDDERPEEAQWRLLRVLVFGKPRPQPAVQMRFAVTATGVKSTGGKKLGIFDIAQVRQILEDVKTGEGFAEIENWQRRRLTLTRAEGRWTLQEKKGKAIELFEDELAPWLEAFTTRTADEAMKVIKR
jgi:hypothetical protein